jgi:hypothetical protein
MKGIILFMSLIFYYLNSWSQYTPSIIYQVQTGGAIYFTYNTFAQYNTGIDCPVQTRVSVFSTETEDASLTQTTRKYNLYIKASNSNFLGLDVAHFYSINELELTITVENTGGIPVTLAPFVITNIYQPIVEGCEQNLPGVPTILNISYHSNGLLGQAPDYYTVDVELGLMYVP